MRNYMLIRETVLDGEALDPCLLLHSMVNRARVCKRARGPESSK